MFDMKAQVLGYRTGRHTQNVNQMLLEVEGITSKDKAQPLLGKKIVWKTPAGREIKGEIIGLHGNKGVVRAKFERNLPGQAIGTKVDLI
jgi:large subunit ribosomal protein L35Ae